jgi:NDP-sugar pyrophosphorylase family protein
MKCLILSAGYGTRLGKLTKDIPKPMIEIGGKPIILHIVDHLALHNLSELIINVHYLPEVIIDQLQSKALYYYEPKLLGHKGTIFALKKWLEGEPFLVLNGDTLTNLNYTEMIKAHKEGTITVAMDEYRAVGSWIYPKGYFDNPDIPIMPFRQVNLEWQDVGNPQRLEQARIKYEL